MSGRPKTWAMQVGVDDAGRPRAIYEDAAMRVAFEELGFDFLMHHINGPARVEDVASLARWAEATGSGFILNQECTERPGAPTGPGSPYRKGGCFFQPSDAFVSACLESKHFRGFCYDEAEHWATNGVWVTGHQRRGFQAHVYDAEGDGLLTAYEGNLHNWRALLERHYGDLTLRRARDGSAPHIIATEHVFPIMHHLFARAGLTPIPKYMKETMQPVAAAMTLGAARQYGCDYWACLDLWGPSRDFPGHPPHELESALLFAYWTGASAAYIENLNYRRALYSASDTADSRRIELSPHGQAARAFVRQYLPAHPRPLAIGAQQLRPRIVILRFEDSDWGQYPRAGYITGFLYGASNLLPDEQTRHWIKIWHVLTHGQTPLAGLTWHANFEMPYRFFFPANSVAVYDHLAADPSLFAGTRLVFLTGKLISPQAYATLQALVAGGLVVVTPRHLAPPEVFDRETALTEPYVEVPAGRGAWIVSDGVTHEGVRRRLASYLGERDEMIFTFGDTDVVFREGGPQRAIEVELRPASAD